MFNIPALLKFYITNMPLKNLLNIKMAEYYDIR